MEPVTMETETSNLMWSTGWEALGKKALKVVSGIHLADELELMK